MRRLKANGINARRYVLSVDLGFPDVPAAAIDWSRGHEFLDQELAQVVRDAALGRRRLDKLYERDWDRQRIIDLFSVIDWMMRLRDLLRGFVPGDWMRALDPDTLERCSGSYVTDDLPDGTPFYLPVEGTPTRGGVGASVATAGGAAAGAGDRPGGRGLLSRRAARGGGSSVTTPSRAVAGAGAARRRPRTLVLGGSLPAIAVAPLSAPAAIRSARQAGWPRSRRR